MAGINTRSNELTELIAVSGELPADAIKRLGGGQYNKNLVTDLKSQKL